MITLITGAPGAGKSAYVVSLLLQFAKNRAIYADGIPDLLVEHQLLEDPNEWQNSVPDGSVIVIDEVQRIWRPRGPGSKVPDSVKMLETHRHRGLDFYIITQSPRLVDTNVRSLVGRHIHLRELGILGRWFYEWPECAENCANGWKNAPIRKKYSLPKHVYGLYKSASEHIKPVRSFPKVVIVLVVALVGVAAFSIHVYNIIKSKNAPAIAVASTNFLPNSNPESIKMSSISSTHIIDDRVDFIPRSSGVPESAPAYDHIRQIVTMPIVAGAVCGSFNDRFECRCYNQQGTNAGLNSDQCQNWLKNPPFNPYKKEMQVENRAETKSAITQTATPAAPADRAASPAAGVAGAGEGANAPG